MKTSPRRNTRQRRHAKITGIKVDRNDIVTEVHMAAAYAAPISPFAFRCKLCDQVHTVSNPKCKNPPKTFTHNGIKRKLSPQFQIIITVPAINQSADDRALAGDLSEWLHSQGLEWASPRNAKK